MTVDASSADDATGSIVSLEKGYFGMSDGVTLTGNRTSAPGSAIYNQGGSIGLGGGTITDNQSMDKGGAIYSEGEIRVSGNVIVSENYDDGVNYENSIVLSGENAYIAATGVLSDTANLQVRRSDADVVKAFVTIARMQMEMLTPLWRMYWSMYITWTLINIQLIQLLDSWKK